MKSISPGALGTGEDLAPDGILDPPLGLAVGVQGLVHPAEFLLQLLEQLSTGGGEGAHVEWQVVVGGDEGGGRRQVVQDDPARTPSGRLPCLGSSTRPPTGAGRRPARPRTIGRRPRSCRSRQSRRAPGRRARCSAGWTGLWPGAGPWCGRRGPCRAGPSCRPRHRWSSAPGDTEPRGHRVARSAGRMLQGRGWGRRCSKAGLTWPGCPRPCRWETPRSCETPGPCSFSRKSPRKCSRRAASLGKVWPRQSTGPPAAAPWPSNRSFMGPYPSVVARRARLSRARSGGSAACWCGVCRAGSSAMTFAAKAGSR